MLNGIEKKFFAFLLWNVNNCAYKDYDKMAERDFQKLHFWHNICHC